MIERRSWMIGGLSLVLSIRAAVSQSEGPSWVCPACGQCTVPDKLACQVPECIKKTTIEYGCKSEEICLLGPTCGDGACSVLATHCPRLWQHWQRFTCGVVRERRMLTKEVQTKEVPSCKCEVRYQCPCCHTQFVPKG